MKYFGEMKYIYRKACLVILSLVATACFFFVWFRFVQDNNQTGHLTGLGNLLMAGGGYTVLYVLVGKYLKAFRIGVDRKANIISSQCITLFVVDFTEIFVSMAITGQFRFFGDFLLRYALLYLVQTIIISILVILFVNIYRSVFPPLKLVEIRGDHINTLQQKMNDVHYKYHIIQSLYYKEEESVLEEAMKNCDAVLINDLPSHEQNRFLKKCFEQNRRVYLTPKITDVMVKASEELNLIDTPLYLLRNSGIPVWKRAIKRTFDIILSGLSLIVLSPVFIVTAIAIHHEDKGPVFYKQERCTINEKRFYILKFRSMIVDAEKDGLPHPAVDNDERITKVGKIIRAMRIDELPQLINILRGEMSIVGPRPERTEHVEKYKQDIPEFSYRTKIKAGLTGYAQVYGKYNTSALDKLKLDLIYITNYSIKLDIQIIIETIKVILKKESTEGFSDSQKKEITQ